jgi:putative hydrolase of the HAD superfamily
MALKCAISTLFLDIGGVLLSQGWDRHMRRRAAEKFDLNHDEMEERHYLTFNTYEEGKLSLDTYLKRVIFYNKRSFSIEEFKKYLFEQSQPMTDMIDFFRNISKLNKIRIGAISNEGRELTVHRIEKFGLKEFVEFFICSCFVHYRKPDEDIYRIALDIGQVKPENALYVDDNPLLVQVAQSMGIHGIVHKSLEETRKELSAVGLVSE